MSVCFFQLIINSQLPLLNKQILFLVCFLSRGHSTPALTERCLITVLRCEVLHAAHNQALQWWCEAMINIPLCILPHFPLFLLILSFLSFPDSWIALVIQWPIFALQIAILLFSFKMCLIFIHSQTLEFMCTKSLSCLKK